uniref:Uncharacterized protein n=1 Tax=Physcomitrium patens TaxID=3218 RepID=A0A2K1KU79_PHYPA|nr:hypothetical protein PHYPA_004322 [Physcomitrium patens]
MGEKDCTAREELLSKARRVVASRSACVTPRDSAATEASILAQDGPLDKLTNHCHFFIFYFISSLIFSYQ